MRRMAIGWRSGLVFFFVVFTGCASLPASSPDQVSAEIFGPRSNLDAVDARGQFQAVYCAVNEDHGRDLPDYRHCDDTFRTIPSDLLLSPALTTPLRPMQPFAILVVPGLGYDCFEALIGKEQGLLSFAEGLGHVVRVAPIFGLADTDRNAAIVRDSIAELYAETHPRKLLVFGYSKGTNDVLAALAEYPEIARLVDAVVGMSSAVGGSAVATEVSSWAVNLLAGLPGANCESATETTLQSLYPETRRLWLAEHTLPPSVTYLSVISLPEPDRVSTALRTTFRKLAKISANNDGQVIARDQVIPGSQVLAFLNADHWATALPVTRSHPMLKSTVVEHNDFPREVLLESILHYVAIVLEED